VLLLKECRVSAAELMDRVSLRSVEDKPGMPPYIKSLADSVTALLVETATDDSTTLRQQVDEIVAKFADFPLARDFSFTTEPDEQAALWDIRKGLFPSVCFARKKGTTVIIEDIAVPIDNLRDCLLDLQGLFQKFAYQNTIIWGHVFDGNVHFVLTPDLSDVAEIEKYKAFMDELADLVVDKYDGSLKAEHGTGRNMAPFVRREWGEQIYGAMQEVKAIFDPDHMLNPGVIINDDPNAHAKNIKPMTPAHDLVDTCTECGFCERSCTPPTVPMVRRPDLRHRRLVRSNLPGGNRYRQTHQGPAPGSVDTRRAGSCRPGCQTHGYGYSVYPFRTQFTRPGAPFVGNALDDGIDRQNAIFVRGPIAVMDAGHAQRRQGILLACLWVGVGR
jgi:D-lactate dehydrogenase